MIYPRPKSRKYRFQDLPKTREEMRVIWREIIEKLGTPYLVKKKQCYTFGDFLEQTREAEKC